MSTRRAAYSNVPGSEERMATLTTSVPTQRRNLWTNMIPRQMSSSLVLPACWHPSGQDCTPKGYSA